MKVGRMLIAAVAIFLFDAVFAGLTCGGVFNWVYQLAPTNVWRPMCGAPGLAFMAGSFVMNILFVWVYMVLSKGIAWRGRTVKGLFFGLCVWAVGILPGMYATYFFMTVAPAVVLYWTIHALIGLPIKGMITALICDSKPTA